MQQFKIDKTRYKELRKRVFFYLGSIYMLVVTAVILIPLLKPGQTDLDPSSAILSLVVMSVVIGFSMRQTIKKQKNLLDSYVLIIDKNLIAREILNQRAILIYFNDISSIYKSKKGRFVITGKLKQEIITIPAQIENYAAVESALKSIKAFDDKPDLTFIQQYPIAASVLVVLLFGVFYLSTNNIQTCISGILLSAILLRSFYKIRANKNISNKAKQKS